MGCCFGTTNTQAPTAVPRKVAPPDEPSSFQTLGTNPNAKRQNPQNSYVLNERNQANRKFSSFVVEEDFEAKNEQRNKELSIMHKTKGNDFFKNKQYKPAIQEYSMAIDLYGKDPTYYTNRALCFKFLARYNDVINDADSSLKLSMANYKAYHLKGIALVELGKSETTTVKVKEGLEMLKTALSLVQGGSDRETKETIQLKVSRAKKVLWLKDKEHAEDKAAETAAFTKKLIANDNSHSSEDKREMEALFNSFVTENKKKYIQELPESFCCKITFELIKVPAISSSGITYEKDTLVEHLTKVGKFDPFTRQHLEAADLIKNKNIERATLSFQEKNPWSFEDVDEDYRKIQF